LAAANKSPSTSDTAAAPPPGEASFAALPADVTAACDSAAARWRALPGTSLVRGDTLLRPGDLPYDLVGDSIIPVPESGLHACFVSGMAPAGLDAASGPRLYWPASDWGMVWRLAADGPDGQSRVFQQALVRCQVAGEWDGGDDSDSTYAPDPFFRERVVCWQHTRLLLPADTAQLGV